MKLSAVIERLEQVSDPEDLAGMARVGIRPDRAFGAKIPALRALAKEIGKDRRLAAQLWEAGYRETQILASLVDDPAAVTVEQMDRWAATFTYWEICDQCCANLFHLHPGAPRRAIVWSARRGEQQKRAGFALMAILAVKDKRADRAVFESFLPPIERGAEDERGPVKKAVSWALRNIGKRELALNRAAVSLARRLAERDSKHARWVARDALKTLER